MSTLLDGVTTRQTRITGNVIAYLHGATDRDAVHAAVTHAQHERAATDAITVTRASADVWTVSIAYPPGVSYAEVRDVADRLGRLGPGFTTDAVRIDGTPYTRWKTQ